MKPSEIPASATSHLISYSSASVDCLEKQLDAQNESTIFGSIGKGGRVGWLARGSSLEVINTTSGDRIAAWNFGAAVQDETTNITCVAEYKYEKSIKLLVAVETATYGGLLCVFDVRSSRIVRAIEVSQAQRITAVEPIHNLMAYEAPVHALCEHLRRFCGIVAVGTQGGRVYVIDMCLDDSQEISDEAMPSHLCYINPQTYDVIRKRDEALSRGEHLCFQFDDDSHKRGAFVFRKPDNTVIKTFDVDDVSVTCLKYIKQAGTLAVGYNFGCFQLWRLSAPALDYSSRYDPDMAPVTHLAYQEPENDPRSFCYVWVARGPLPSDPLEEWVSTIQLFQLVYNRKSWTDQFGLFYEDMMSVGQRFDHMLSGSSATACSRVLACFTIEDPFGHHSQNQAEEESFDEAFHGPDLGLCAFAWEAISDDAQGRTSCHFALFDINRWYHAQMPNSFRFFGTSHEPCPFFSFYTLSSVMETCAPDCLLSVSVGAETVTRFNSSSVPPPELHTFPASLAFNTCCLTETGVVHAKFLGMQRQVLNDMTQHGPAALMNPHDLFNLAMCAGLLPKGMDHLTASSFTVLQQREVILCVALEYGLLDFLTKCCHEWTDTEFVHAGCSLRFLLDWTWSRVAQIKDNLDKLSTPLYDWSGMQPDRQTLQQLQNNHLQLCRLVSVIQCLGNQATPTTQQGLQDLDTKLNVVTLITQHLQLVLWFLSTGLLPEYPEGQESECRFSYPIKSLTQSYSTRRKEIQRLHSSLDDTEVLLIDGLVKHAGQPLINVWCKAGGSEFYPPPCLYALLNIYLLEGVSLPLKHSIVMYLLIDLVSLSTDEKFVEDLGKFCQAFGISQNETRLMQAFWLLDHQDYEEALLVLLDPMVDIEMQSWQHSRILKAFLYQGHSELALKYLRVKKPPMNNPEDVKLRLTILLANRLTSEAFQYQRACRDPSSAEDLLSHFFLGCQQTRTVDALLQLPLNEVEEKYFIKHLQESREPHSLEILVMHYLQRSRYVEAIRCNEKLKANLISEKDGRARERAAARNAIIECYSRILPSVQRKLTYGGGHHIRKRSQLLRREVSRPKPLSTMVNRAKKSHVISHASLIHNVLEKVHETKPDAEDTPTKDDAPPRAGPFVCTPITPRHTTRISDVVDVVYPTIEKQPEPPVQLSPVKKPHTLSPRKSFSSSFVAKRSMSAYSEVLSLLESPVIKRISPSRGKQEALPQPTPQSILKVRKVVRKSVSPSNDVKVRPLQLMNLINSDMGLSTPPKFQRKKIAFAEPSIEVEQPETSKQPSPPSVKTAVSNTPKSLRFALPDDDTPEKDGSIQMAYSKSPYPGRAADNHPAVLQLLSDSEEEDNIKQQDDESLETSVVKDVTQDKEVESIDVSGDDGIEKEEMESIDVSGDDGIEKEEMESDVEKVDIIESLEENEGEGESEEDIDVIVDEDITFHIHHKSHVHEEEEDAEMMDTEPIPSSVEETDTSEEPVMELPLTKTSAEPSQDTVPEQSAVEEGSPSVSKPIIPGTITSIQDGDTPSISDDVHPTIADVPSSASIQQDKLLSSPCSSSSSMSTLLPEQLAMTVSSSSTTVSSSGSSVSVTLDSAVPLLVVSASSESEDNVVVEENAPLEPEVPAVVPGGVVSNEVLTKVSPLRVSVSEPAVESVSDNLRVKRSPSRSPKKKSFASPAKQSISLEAVSTTSPVRVSPRLRSNDVNKPEDPASAPEGDAVFKTPPQPTRQTLVMTPPTSPESVQESPAQVARRVSPRRTPSGDKSGVISPRSVKQPVSPQKVTTPSSQLSPRTRSGREYSPAYLHDAQSERLVTEPSTSPVSSTRSGRTPTRKTRSKKQSESVELTDNQESVTKPVRQSNRKSVLPKQADNDETIEDASVSVPVSPSRVLRSSARPANVSVQDAESSEPIKSPSRRSRRNKQTDNSESIVKTPENKPTAKKSVVKSPEKSPDKVPVVPSPKKSPARKSVVKTPDKSPSRKSVVKGERKSPSRKAKQTGTKTEVDNADTPVTGNHTNVEIVETPVTRTKTTAKKQTKSTQSSKNIVPPSPSRRSTRSQPALEEDSLDILAATPPRKILTAKKSVKKSAPKDTESVVLPTPVATSPVKTGKKTTGRKKKSKKEEPSTQEAEDEEVFTFSEPMIVHSQQVQDEDESIQPSFVFSPPITRTRSVLSSVSEETDQPGLLTGAVTVKDKRSTKKVITRSRKPISEEAAVASPSDSVINFISPVVESTSQGPSTRQRTKRIPSLSMSLRGAGAKKKRVTKLY